MKKFLCFLITRLGLKHIAVMAAVLVLLFVCVSVGLRLYTDHGTKIPVPDFTGLALEKAQELAKAKSFVLEIADSVYSTDFAPGAIVAHTPAAGFSVKEGRRIFVTLNSTSPEYIKMPDLLNTSLRQAKEILFVHGLELGKISYAPDFAKNYVLAQNHKGMPLPKNSKIAKRSKIDLVLGLGSSNKEVLMPDLVGLSYEKAVQKIMSKSLLVGAEVFPDSIETFDDSVKTLVVRQAPTFADGKFLKIGTLVDIWLERDSALLDTVPTEEVSREL